MTVTPQTTPAQIMSLWREHQNHRLIYTTTYRILHVIIGDIHHQQAFQVALLPSYEQHLC